MIIYWLNQTATKIVELLLKFASGLTGLDAGFRLD